MRNNSIHIRSRDKGSELNKQFGHDLFDEEEDTYTEVFNAKRKDIDDADDIIEIDDDLG